MIVVTIMMIEVMVVVVKQNTQRTTAPLQKTYSLYQSWFFHEWQADFREYCGQF